MIRPANPDDSYFGGGGCVIPPDPPQVSPLLLRRKAFQNWDATEGARSHSDATKKSRSLLGCKFRS